MDFLNSLSQDQSVVLLIVLALLALLFFSKILKWTIKLAFTIAIITGLILVALYLVERY